MSNPEHAFTLIPVCVKSVPSLTEMLGHYSTNVKPSIVSRFMKDVTTTCYLFQYCFRERAKI